MTGPSGNRLSICHLRFRIASVNRNSWGGDPESLGANRSAYYGTLETSHYLFTIVIS